VAEGDEDLFGDLFDEGRERAVEGEGDSGADGFGIELRWGRRGVDGLFGERRCGEAVGEEAAGEAGAVDEGSDRIENDGGLKGLLEDGIAAGAAGLLLIDGFEEAGDEDDAAVAVGGMGLDVAADFVAGAKGEEDVDEDKVRGDVVEAEQGRFAVGDGDDFVALFAKDAFAHALGMGAIVCEQNANR